MPTSRETAFAIGALVAEHRGNEVVVLDVSVQAGWTDFFVIATATSSTHLRGLARYVEDFASASKLSRLNKPGIADDEEWVLLDLGDIVVHLMSEGARAFYELEKLWFQAPASKVEPPAPPLASGEGAQGGPARSEVL